MERLVREPGKKRKGRLIFHFRGWEWSGGRGGQTLHHFLFVPSGFFEMSLAYSIVSG